MIKVSNLMSEYFSEETNPRPRFLVEGLPKEYPITPTTSEWKVTEDGKSLLRSFTFEDDRSLRMFINELLSMQEHTEHHGQILIDEKTVKVKVRTKTLNKITELDVEYASHLDKIFGDVDAIEQSKQRFSE